MKLLWQNILSAAESGADCTMLFNGATASFVKHNARVFQITEKKMFTQMVLQSCELDDPSLVKHTLNWGLQNCFNTMPGPQELCAEILYRPGGCALFALNYIVENVQLFPKDEHHTDGFPLTTAIYMGNKPIWDGLSEAFPQSFNPERIIQAIILSEEKMAVDWFFNHKKCQNLPAQFYFNLLSFVCSNHSEFGEQILLSRQNEVTEALQELQKSTGIFEFPFAHRNCRVSKHGLEDDLSHVLWVCGAAGSVLLRYLSPFLIHATHLLHMVKIRQFEAAELLQVYVSDEELEGIVENIPQNLLDKTAKTSKLYARFMNKRLHQAIRSEGMRATDQVVRRM